MKLDNIEQYGTLRRLRLRTPDAEVTLYTTCESNAMEDSFQMPSSETW